MGLELTPDGQGAAGQEGLRPGAGCPAAAPHDPARDRGPALREDPVRRAAAGPDRGGRRDRTGRGRPAAEFTFRGEDKADRCRTRRRWRPPAPAPGRPGRRSVRDRLTPVRPHDLPTSESSSTTRTSAGAGGGGGSGRRGSGSTRPSADERVQRPGALDLVRPDRVERRPVHGPRSLRSRSTASSRPRACRSVPVVRAAAAGSVAPARADPAAPPCACARRTGRTRTPVTGRCRPARRAPSERRSTGRPWPGPSGSRSAARAPLGDRGRRARRHGQAVDQPGQHPAHVRVQDGVPAAVRERRDRRGGVRRRRRAACAAPSTSRGTSPPYRSTQAVPPRAGAAPGAGSPAGPTPGPRRRRARLGQRRPGSASGAATPRTPAARGRPASAAASPR